MRKSELHILWDDHVTATMHFEKEKSTPGANLETLEQRVRKTKAAYEEFLRTGKVRR